MTQTLERELETIATTPPGYSVRLSYTSYLHVHLYWHGKEIDHKLWAQWMWHKRRASRWVRRTIREHQRMVEEMGVPVA